LAQPIGDADNCSKQITGTGAFGLFLFREWRF
jgi:hypothetical protein